MTMTMEDRKDVAINIIQQIPKMTKMAVGYREPQMHEDADGTGLVFRVNSKPYRYCSVILTANDTYNVCYFRIKRGSYQRVEIARDTDVYAENLGETIYSLTQRGD